MYYSSLYIVKHKSFFPFDLILIKNSQYVASIDSFLSVDTKFVQKKGHQQKLLVAP